MIDLKQSIICVTGGTGSFGSAFINYLINNDLIPKQLIVYSRDWQKQKALRDSLYNPPWIKWVLGDVRDKEQLTKALKPVHYVIHAAAIKCIEACENNTIECTLTNEIGTINVIEACKNVQVKKAVLISTDKAVLPINTYGTSKKMAEKHWINANKDKSTIFSVCRYGNVAGSNGSVLPIYKKLMEEGVESLPVTDERCTRFWYDMEDAIKFVLETLEKDDKGDTFVPIIPSIRITDLCKALDMPYHIVGLREGEKLWESMIPPDPVTGNPGYDSETNPHFLTVEEIKESIRSLL